MADHRQKFRNDYERQLWMRVYAACRADSDAEGTPGWSQAGAANEADAAIELYRKREP